MTVQYHTAMGGFLTSLCAAVALQLESSQSLPPSTCSSNAARIRAVQLAELQRPYLVATIALFLQQDCPCIDWLSIEVPFQQTMYSALWT